MFEASAEGAAEQLDRDETEWVKYFAPDVALYLNRRPSEYFEFAGPGQLDQYAELYDVNVLSTQRVNRAALPHLGRQEQSLLIWVSSSSLSEQREQLTPGH